jgi:hypothetical protein
MMEFAAPKQFAHPVQVKATVEQRLRRSGGPAALRSGVQSPSVEVFRQAASDPSHLLDPPVREQLNRAFPHDFALVRVHTGEASRAAAASIGARAYTLGGDIHLGAEAAGLSGPERTALLLHEATHSAQQGMRQVRPAVGLPISHPADAAEREAEVIGKTVTAPSRAEQRSPSLAVRDRMRATSSLAQIAASVPPHIQRDLTGKKAVQDGTFDLNLKTESHPGASSGMSGTIEFTPDKAAPDSNLIKLLQVVRLEDLTSGKDYVWTGGEARRSAMQTTAAKGIQPGYFVDHSAAAATPRSKKTDAPVSPYYRSYWPNATVSQDGKKKGASITSASLWDNPNWGMQGRFSFETAAKATDTGYHYATLTWGFTVSDPAKGVVDKEYADAHRAPSMTFHAAVAEFNKAYKNPGSATAP